MCAFISGPHFRTYPFHHQGLFALHSNQTLSLLLIVSTAEILEGIILSWAPAAWLHFHGIMSFPCLRSSNDSPYTYAELSTITLVILPTCLPLAHCGWHTSILSAPQRHRVPFHLRTTECIVLPPPFPMSSSLPLSLLQMSWPEYSFHLTFIMALSST